MHVDTATIIMFQSAGYSLALPAFVVEHATIQPQTTKALHSSSAHKGAANRRHQHKPDQTNISFSFSSPLFPSAPILSHQRRLGKHRQRLRTLSRHHARRRGRGNAGPHGQRRRNERGRAGGQGQGSSHLELHGGYGLIGE